MSWSVYKVFKSLNRASLVHNGITTEGNTTLLRPWFWRFLAASASQSNSAQVNSALAKPSTDVLPPSRIVPKSKDEVMQLTEQKIIQPPDPKILQVAILGTPNSGKSTVANKLMGWRVCSVSKKAHTTRHNAKGIYTLGNTQIVFLDTPGLISAAEKKRFNLEESMLVDPEESLKEADLVLVLIDAADKWTRHKLNSNIIRLLNQYSNKKSILVLNKVDILKSKRLLLDIVNSLTLGKIDNRNALQLVKEKPKVKTGEEIIQQTMKRLREKSIEEDAYMQQTDPETSTGWPHFLRIFMISALEDDGIEDLKNYVLEHAKPGPWKYPASFVTDQTPHEIAILAVRGRFLDHLKQEMPYSLKFKIELWEVDQHGLLRIVVLVRCPTSNVAKIAIGAGGETISTIANEARQDLMNTFRCDVMLKVVIQSA